MYDLKYLPLAKKDLTGIINYIANVLKAPKAAIKLLDNIESSILRLQKFPYSCKKYQSVESLETGYRILSVKNYIVFYVLSEHIVEIHRIIYAGMDYEKLIAGL
jgi:toxin ParE1/3/4